MPRPVKPPALLPSDRVRLISPASPAEAPRIRRGVAELQRLGYRILHAKRDVEGHGYFAGRADARAKELAEALRAPNAKAVVCIRGGYGSGSVFEHLKLPPRLSPKLLVGYSDITMLQAYLWTRYRWVTLYGPMVAWGFEARAGRRDGYDADSWQHASRGTRRWSMPLRGETMVAGSATGVLLGGCITLLQCLMGTPWELDARGSILLLEDLNMKPYQLDRMLMHLLQAGPYPGKFRGVKGIVLGEFPGCEPPKGSKVTARDVCRRLLAPLGIPIVYGAAVGHTPRPMLTVPLGVRARLDARGAGKLEILERATVAQGAPTLSVGGPEAFARKTSPDRNRLRRKGASRK